MEIDNPYSTLDYHVKKHVNGRKIQEKGSTDDRVEYTDGTVYSITYYLSRLKLSAKQMHRNTLGQKYEIKIVLATRVQYAGLTVYS